MRSSLRGRLQLWYAGVLLAVIAGFGGFVYAQSRAAGLEQVDARLRAGVGALDAALRAAPPHVVTGEEPPRPRDDGPPDRGFPKGVPRPGQGKGVDRPRPMPPPRERERERERFIEELNLGAAFDGFADAGGRPRFGVWRDDELLKASDPDFARRSPPDVVSRGIQWQTDADDRGPFRMAAARSPQNVVIAVAAPVGRLHNELTVLAWRLAVGGGVAWLLGLAGGWWATGRALQPVAAIAATAGRLSADRLDARISTERIDRELLGLADALNGAFARLEAAFERQARFTADASHELRTPLAVLSAQIELALSRPRDAAAYRDALAHCQDAAGRMRGLVDGLLMLARADAGKLALDRRPCDLRRVVEEVVDEHRPQAERAGVFLTDDTPPRAVTVSVDATFVGRVLANLLANALRHTPAGGAVTVVLVEEPGAATLAVRDTGSGILEADQGHIFERFYRADAARSRQSGGNGLGLTICKSLVEAHGGAIAFTSRPGAGTAFTVRLPLDGPAV